MSKLALGRTFSEKTRALISASKLGQGGTIINITDKETGIVSEYSSINQASKILGIPSLTLQRYIIANKPLKGK
jgi:hypothetical protein